MEYSHTHTQIQLPLLCTHQVDPATGEAEEEGVEDEYKLEDLQIVAADYMLKVGVSNFKNAWDSMGPDHEYGLGLKESL